jgi:hypothetical protein
LRIRDFFDVTRGGVSFLKAFTSAHPVTREIIDRKQ